MLADAPWTLDAGDLARLRGAGLSDQEILHAVVLSSFFNYLNRVADAVNLDFDYESPLPRLAVDRDREPVPRPPRQEWPAGGAFGLRLADRPQSRTAYDAWRAYVMDREAPLSRRERRIVARAAAEALCDARSFADEPPPATPREHRFAAYSAKLTSTPWKLTQDDLRSLELDDAAILDLVSVASSQNTASRLGLVLSDMGPWGPVGTLPAMLTS